VRGRQSRCDDLCNSVKVVQKVIVPEAQHAIAFALEKGGSAFIGRAFRVLAAIGFDDQPCFVTNEVGDERTNRLLSSEFGAVELRAAKDRPKLPLRIG
jgi:hypothetical protein